MAGEKMSLSNSLIITDVQVDFCPGGALAVNGGNEIVPLINRIMKNFNRIVATQDWHPQNHRSFASNHRGKSPYDTITIDGIEQVLWPDHCVQGTEGSNLHPQLNIEPVHLLIRKGTDYRIDSYSTFFENDRKTATGLSGYLTSLNVTDVYLCGLATDFCVFYSAMDSTKLGFKTHVILDACRGIDVPPGRINECIGAMKANKITIINSGDI